MKCANHPDIDSVSQCISCGRQICKDCRVVSKKKDLCRTCFVKRVGEATKIRHSPLAAALLSLFIPGAGQIYNGQIKKGIAYLLGFWLVLPWLFGIKDAYATAREVARYKLVPRYRPGHTMALIMGLTIFILYGSISGFFIIKAVPYFVTAREKYVSYYCRRNLEQVESAKKMYFVLRGRKDRMPKWKDLIPKYMQMKPECPTGGKYSLGGTNTPAKCNVDVNQTEWQGDDHVLGAGVGWFDFFSAAKKRAGVTEKRSRPGRATKRSGKRTSDKKSFSSKTAPGRACRIYMKNGEKFSAKILKETKTELILEIEGGSFSLNKKDIARIE